LQNLLRRARRSSGGRRASRRQLVFDHLADLHHEAHALKFGDLFERVARDGDQVCEPARLDAAEQGALAREQFGVVDRRGADDLKRVMPDSA